VRPGGRGDAGDADDFLGGVRAEDACLPAAARLAAAANAAGSVWRPASLATRMVMSCRLGGSFMCGTVNVVCDISGLAEQAALALLAAE